MIPAGLAVWAMALSVMVDSALAAESIAGEVEIITCPAVQYHYDGQLSISGSGASHWHGDAPVRQYPAQVVAHSVSVPQRKMTCLYQGGSIFADTAIHRSFDSYTTCKKISNFRFRCYSGKYKSPATPKSPLQIKQ
jgi:hypothetical protein